MGLKYICFDLWVDIYNSASYGVDRTYQSTKQAFMTQEEKAGPVELATISFGQRFEITPLQMVTAVSSIANKGTYIKPRIVKSIINSETGEKTGNRESGN